MKRPSPNICRCSVVEKMAALGAPVFACTPDQFPDLMAAALRREDIHRWAAKEDIKTISVGGEPL